MFIIWAAAWTGISLVFSTFGFSFAPFRGRASEGREEETCGGGGAGTRNIFHRGHNSNILRRWTPDAGLPFSFPSLSLMRNLGGYKTATNHNTTNSTLKQTKIFKQSRSASCESLCVLCGVSRVAMTPSIRVPARTMNHDDWITTRVDASPRSSLPVLELGPATLLRTPYLSITNHTTHQSLSSLTAHHPVNVVRCVWHQLRSEFGGPKVQTLRRD